MKKAIIGLPVVAILILAIQYGYNNYFFSFYKSVRTEQNCDHITYHDLDAISNLTITINTPIIRDSALTFFAIGCMGKPGPGQTTMAKTLEQYQKHYQPDFALITGDNFYNCGVENIKDPLWQTGFENLFKKEHFNHPFYAVLGNHDYEGSANYKAQLMYNNERWNAGQFYKIEVNPISIFTFDTELLIQQKEASIEPIKKWIQAIKEHKGIKIFMGHHPMINQNYSKYPGLQILQDFLTSSNAVYICSHHHILDYNQEDSLHHIISGSASDIEPQYQNNNHLYSEAKIGATYFQYKDSTLYFDFITNEGIAYSDSILMK